MPTDERPKERERLEEAEWHREHSPRIEREGDRLRESGEGERVTIGE
jgi:hypothetical protein